MDDLADSMYDLTPGPTFTNWLYDGADQDFVLTPLTYTAAAVGGLVIRMMTGMGL